jgi:hypothetical protein
MPDIILPLDGPTAFGDCVDDGLQEVGGKKLSEKQEPALKIIDEHCAHRSAMV